MIFCLTPALPVCAFEADGVYFPQPCLLTLPNGERLAYRMPKDPPKPKHHGFWHKAGVVFLFLLL